jgi:hypothetical protein
MEVAFIHVRPINLLQSVAASNPALLHAGATFTHTKRSLLDITSVYHQATVMPPFPLKAGPHDLTTVVVKSPVHIGRPVDAIVEAYAPNQSFATYRSMAIHFFDADDANTFHDEVRANAARAAARAAASAAESARIAEIVRRLEAADANP